MIRSLLLLTVFLFCSIIAFSQVSFYADTYVGGVTGGGYAPDYSNGGTGIINVYIEPGSTIRKAYLFAGREGAATGVTVTLNGTYFTFGNPNQVSPTFQSPDYGGNSAVHAIDVSSVVNAAVTSYTLVVPDVPGPSDKFTDFYLFIAYANPSLKPISVQFFVNAQDFGPDVKYTFNLAKPVNSTLPVAVGLDLGYMCYASDADEVYLNGTDLGSVYGPEPNSGSCQGPCANFYYQNNTVNGLLGNNADQAMSGNDVLSNAQALIPNNSTSFTMEFTHSSSDNSHWGFFIVSGASCALPVASAGPDTAFCYGNFAQLYAGGGNTYIWSPGAWLSDSTKSNPQAFPSVTTTYTVTVSNGCGSSTTTANIIVYPSPPVPRINPSNDTLYCSIDPSYISYQWYFNDTIIAGSTGTSYFATKSGNYNVAVTDTNGCVISVGINIVINGIENYNADNSVSIYPNPAGNKFTVYGLQFTVENMVLYDVLGKVCYQSQITNPTSETDVSSLSSGIYFVQMIGEKKIWIGRFVKE